MQETDRELSLNQAKRCRDNLEEVAKSGDLYLYFFGGEYEDPDEPGEYIQDEGACDITWKAHADFSFAGAEVLLECGGPNTWLNTSDGCIHCYWGEHTRVSLSKECLVACYRVLEDYYNEMLPAYRRT